MNESSTVESDLKHSPSHGEEENCQVEHIPEKGSEHDKISPGKNTHSHLTFEELYELAESHGDRFQRLGEPDDIDKAIEYGTLALKLTPDEYPDLPPRLAILGVYHCHRFQRLGDLHDIDKSIEYNARSVNLTLDDDPDLSHRLLNLGVSHRDRFQRLGELDDMEKAIKYKTHALNLTPEDHPEVSYWLASLGSSYYDRYQRLGEPDDIEKSIDYDTRALQLTPDDHPGRPQRLASLGSSYYSRFQSLGDLNDIQKSIEYNTSALDLTADDHPDLFRRLASLGASYYDRFQRLGELGDIEKAIEYETRALDLTPEDCPDLTQRFASLGMSHYDRFQRLGQHEDIEKSIEYKTLALILTPDDHPYLSHRLGSLGLSHHDRFQHFGDVSDIEKSIECGTRALALTSNDDPQLSHRLASLGISYYGRFQRLGELDDLEKAIQHNTQALDLTPDGHPDLSRRLASLGASYYTRFQRLGDLDDVDKAVEYNTRALQSTLDDHPDLPQRLADLGTSYYDRLQRLGEFDDMEKSIEYKTRALDLTADDHPDLAFRLGNLGVSYYDRFQRLGNLGDIEKAIEYNTRALELTSDSHPDLSHRLANLGASYYDRFKRLGEIYDIEKAIEYDTRALRLISNDHPYFSYRLANLGVSYHDRFKCLGEPGDIAKAIKYSTDALDLTSDDLPDLPLRHYHLAVALFSQFQRNGDVSVSQNSLESFRKASQSSIGAPRAKFQYALYWATLASEYNSMNPIEAYQTTIDLLPQFIWLGATTNQRYDDLLKVGNLAVKAASAAILSSQYQLALEWLEHARCVVWYQSIMLRSPLEVLQASYPDLATHLQSIATQLHNTSIGTRASQALSSSSLTEEQIGQQHRHLAKEYNDLISQTRKLSGFEDFLQPTKIDGLIKAARNGPIVVINCHTACQALLILPRQYQVHSIELPNFSPKDVQYSRSYMQKLLIRTGLRERGAQVDHTGEEETYEDILKHLWDGIVKPVLDFLGYTRKLSTGNLPHITWCPTGIMSFLPLHAAGDYNQPHSRVFDYVMSSYTPTLTALLTSSPSSLRPVLGIGQETTSTPGYRLSNLPGTIKELNIMKQHTRNMGYVEFSELQGGRATKAAVLDAMEQHDWVHLACHAHQNIRNATESGFFLQDGILDLASINRRSLKNKGLAFLSACQTATGDEKLPDEAVHLASGMLMAGYSGVIATMWSVADEDAPFVADKVYEQLMKGGSVGNGEAGKALYYAIAALREKVGEKEFGRWVPYIHIGS